ncbi:MAG: BTAD domain-containing putative transcriptional regulator, partial [Anaerolineales bacterium]
MTEKLQILLLGPPVVHWKGEMLSFQRRLPRALLFYLAWQGRMVLRETILDLFWGSNSKSSRSRLTETISRLRATLPDDDFLISHEGLIGLDMNRVYVDCQHFEELVDLAGHIPWQIPETEPLPLETYQILSQANQLWRGIFALPGVSFPTAALDHWLRQSTERLQGLRFNILVKLSAHAYAMLDFQGSLDLARIALEYEPYNEDVQLKIMQSLVKLGQFGEALQYFENTRQSMLEELEINPSPQMIQLYREIRRLDAPPLSDYEPKWELHPSMDVPFVGRRNALLKINQSLAQGKTMVILGESGQGKSRLVQEYVNLINPRPRLLLTVCRSTESTLPFH